MTGLRHFARFLWRDQRLEMTVVGLASLTLSLTEGVGLLMLVPMLRLVGVSTGDGATDRLARGIEQLIRGIGLEPTLGHVLGIVVALVTARAALQLVLSTWDARLEAAVIGRLRARLFAAVVALPWARFTGERPGKLLYAIGPQVDDVHAALLLLLEGASLMAAVAAAAVVALIVSPPLTLVVAVAGVVLFAVARQMRAPGHAEGEQLLAATSGLFTRIGELLGGLKMVHAHGAELRATNSVTEETAAWAALTRRTASHRARVNFALAVVAVLMLSGLVWASVSVARLSPATLLLLLLLYTRLVPRIAELQATGSSLAQALASYDAVAVLLARCEQVRADDDRAAQTAASADVAFTSADSGEPLLQVPSLEVRDATVRYPGAASAALSHCSARFPAGSVTVVSGPSGAGKTTLADLLLGLLEPERGAMLVDGRPLAGLSRVRWRERVGYLAQEPMLLHGTIRENLLFARPEATEAELGAALTAAACDFVTWLPAGLDAPVGERGVMLSGGERQRLALARALLRQPGLLVLDEATSALDAETEKRILETVRTLGGRCTVVFFTHREAPRAIADQVIQL